MKIDRPAVDLEIPKENYDGRVGGLADSVGYARRDPKNLPSLQKESLDIITCGSVVDPESLHILPALKLGAQASAALFATAANPTGPVTVPLGEGVPVTYSSGPDESTVHPQRWVTGFYMNVLCNDADGLDRLEQIQAETLRKSTTRSPVYDYLYMETLRLFRRSDPETPQKLIEAMNATNPNRATVYDADWSLLLVAHQLEVLMYVATGDPKFNEGMTKALEAHKKYWTKGKKRRDWSGFVSIELTALAALGISRGLPLEVESPYLFMKLAGG